MSAVEKNESPMAEPQISENVPVVTEVVGDRKTSVKFGRFASHHDNSNMAVLCAGAANAVAFAIILVVAGTLGYCLGTTDHTYIRIAFLFWFLFGVSRLILMLRGFCTGWRVA